MNIIREMRRVGGVQVAKAKRMPVGPTSVSLFALGVTVTYPDIFDKHPCQRVNHHIIL